MSPQEIVDAINEGYSNKIDQEVFMSAIVRKELKLEWFLLMMEKLLQLIQLFQSRTVCRC